VGFHYPSSRLHFPMTKDACLGVIGQIAVGWSEAEECVRQMLWLYLGTDRPTFSIVTNKMRASDIEKLLKALVEDKESNTRLKADILTALQWVSVLRENRNNALHGASVRDMSDDAWPLDALREIGEQLLDCAPRLRELCDRSLRFVIARDTVETPMGDRGDESFPGSDEPASYEQLNWPSKPRKIDPW
jgi:hypothetical protein